MDDMISKLTKEEFNELCEFFGVDCVFLNKDCLKNAIIKKRNQEQYQALKDLIIRLNLDKEIIKKILLIMASHIEQITPAVQVKVEEPVEIEIHDHFNR